MKPSKKVKDKNSRRVKKHAKSIRQLLKNSRQAVSAKRISNL